MSGFDIGLSGLDAAQAAFEVIGNNIANAATPGYHCQELELSSAYSSQPGSTTFIGGVNVEGVSRAIDTLLEQEIVRQQSTLAALIQETSVLGTIQTAFGEFASEESGLNATIDSFFTSLQDLSAHPQDSIYQNQLVNTAESMASQFRTLGQYFTALNGQVTMEARYATDSINVLLGQVAEFNGEIQKIEMVGGQANSMRDQRDQCISELSELIGIQTISRDNGVTDIRCDGMPLVTGSMANVLELGYSSDAKLGLTIEGGTAYSTSIEGGSIGGLLTLNNDVIDSLQTDMDNLANTIIQQMNQYQVMGVGAAGSFTELTSSSLISDNLADLDNVTDGHVFIRVTNTDTGEITRHAIAIDAVNDTLTDVATAMSAVSGLTASVNASSQLTIAADPGYKFDFLPCMLPEPGVVDFDDPNAPTVSVSGVYEGSVNETFTCSVIGDGAVGNGALELEVRDSGGELIRTVDIGTGYAAGDLLDLGNGINIAVSIGNLAQTDGDSFTVEAYASTDTSGLLAATGTNTLLSGNSAETMSVSTAITDNPSRIATSLSGEMTDNYNVTRMADVQDLGIDSLGGATCGEFYRALVTDVGQQIATKELYQENVEVMVANLANQQSDISGVDINRESAKLLVFEQMYQAMAQFISSLNESVASLMDLV